MNKTSACSKFEIHSSSFNSRQLAVLTIFNLIVMLGNVSLNILVTHTLNKTKQIANVTFKFIFMLNTSDVLTGVFAQSLLLVAFYERNFLIQRPYRILSTFLLHLSGCVIALLGIDRYIRIKYYSKFESVWTTEFVKTLLFIECLLAVFQTVMLEVGLCDSRDHIALIVYNVTDGITISIIAFLHIQTFRASNALQSASSLSSLSRGRKIITKLTFFFFSTTCGSYEFFT